MTLLVVALSAVFFAGVAMTVNEGLWSNTVSLLCIMLGGLMAIVAGVPLGMWGLEQIGSDTSFAWYYAFAGMWLVFAVSISLMRLATDRVSRVRVRFLALLDKIAGPLMGVFVALMLTSFATYTLIRVPLEAGNWTLTDASANQKKAIEMVHAPFFHVANSFAEGEDIATPFLGN